MCGCFSLESLSNWPLNWWLNWKKPFLFHSVIVEIAFHDSHRFDLQFFSHADFIFIFLCYSGFFEFIFCYVFNRFGVLFHKLLEKKKKFNLRNYYKTKLIKLLCENTRCDVLSSIMYVYQVCVDALVFVSLWFVFRRWA